MAPAAMAQATAAAQECTADSIRAAVEQAGRALNRIHQEMQPRLEAGFRKLKAKRGWSDDEYVDRANDFLVDDRTEAYDAKASELLARLDRLGETTPGEQPDCSRVPELEATALELAAAVRGKLRYMLSRLDAATGEGATAAGEPPRKPDPTPPARAPASPTGGSEASGPTPLRPGEPPAGTKPKAQAERPAAEKGERGEKAEKGPAPAVPGPQASAAPSPPPAAPRRPPTSGWTTSTVDDRAAVPPPPPAVSRQPVPMPPPVTAPASADQHNEFTIEEIREASRGFFGALSTELANVIEHAFSVGGGRPTGYVLGQEGGGAFIAGLRYGRGTLYTRSGAAREVFWHGPSIGYDFGASGSKTLFLVYRMHDPLDIFTGFSGVDGSAYLIGGVGMTLLTDGRLILAPIRSGIGLRLGASIGYIRFTPRPTWNPF
jgi:hypothetical protein